MEGSLSNHRYELRLHTLLHD